MCLIVSFFINIFFFSYAFQIFSFTFTKVVLTSKLCFFLNSNYNFFFFEKKNNFILNKIILFFKCLFFLVNFDTKSMFLIIFYL